MHAATLKSSFVPSSQYHVSDLRERSSEARGEDQGLADAIRDHIVFLQYTYACRL